MAPPLFLVSEKFAKELPNSSTLSNLGSTAKEFPNLTTLSDLEFHWRPCGRIWKFSSNLLSSAISSLSSSSFGYYNAYL